MATFTSVVFQNEFLSEGADEVQAVVEVTCADAGKAGEPGRGRRDHHHRLLRFHGGRPHRRRPPRRRRRPRGDPRRHVVRRDRRHQRGPPGLRQRRRRLGPGPGRDERGDTRRPPSRPCADSGPAGGTAIGQWLNAAAYMFVNSPVVQRHALLLTDGKNGEGESDAGQGSRTPPPGSSSATAAGWAPTGTCPSCAASPRRCSASVELIADPKDMAEDFAAVMRAAASRGVADAALRRVGTSRRRRGVRPPGLAHGRGPHRARRGRRRRSTATTRPGPGATRPASTTSGSAYRSSPSARPGPWPGPRSSSAATPVVRRGDHRHLERRRHPHHPDRAGDRPLHGSDSSGRRHPGGPGRPSRGRRRLRHDQARRGRAAGGRDRQRRRHRTACARWSTSRRAARSA